MLRIAEVVVLCMVLLGCGSDSDRQSTCLGFESPNISVVVVDSITDQVIANSAQVSIHIQSPENLVVDTEFVAADDPNSNAEPDSYWALLNVNSGDFQYDIVVIEANYHSFVVKGLQFTVDASCGGDNGITQAVYLCPLGTACL